MTGDHHEHAGCVTAQDVAQALEDPDPPETVADLVQRPAVLDMDSSPRQILSALHGYAGTGVPILDADEAAVTGWITYETLLATMHPDISRRGG